MNKDLQQQITSLEKEIIKEELKIGNTEKKDTKFVRKSLSVIESDLKYLSIVANATLNLEMNRIKSRLEVTYL